MSLLSGFLQGAADQFIVENNKKEAERKAYMDRKRDIADRQRIAAEERKARRAERLEERKWDQEDRDAERSRKVDETFSDGTSLIERLGDGTTRVVRPLTKAEIEEKDQDRRYREAQIGAYNRGGSGGSGDDESAYKVTGDEVLGLLGVMNEEELAVDPSLQDAYVQLKGRRLTETQKDEIRRRFRARMQAARNRNRQAQRGAIMFDEGTGINAEDQSVGIIDALRKGE